MGLIANEGKSGFCGHTVLRAFRDSAVIGLIHANDALQLYVDIVLSEHSYRYINLEIWMTLRHLAFKSQISKQPDSSQFLFLADVYCSLWSCCQQKASTCSFINASTIGPLRYFLVLEYSTMAAFTI